MTDTPSEPGLLLVVRFTASISDLPLVISSPSTTTTVSLKCLIRSHISEPYSLNRLRLIHAGKVLTDSAPLSTLFKHVPPPPRDGGGSNVGFAQSAKGKAPIYNIDESKESLRKVYIHCSIGDTLSPAELASEASQASALESSLRTASTTRTPSQPINQLPSESADSPRRLSLPSTPAPQGFDRLLNAGFTASEVASLRSQFLSNISYTHTPDTMPSGATLRILEDRWLDTSAHEQTATPAVAADGEVATTWTGGFETEDGGLEDILWGNLLGFFWPMGALVWGMREEGVWTTRRKVAVAIGCLVNLIFGFVKWNA